MPILWNGAGLALLLTITAQSSHEDYRTLDSWDEPNGWTTYLDAHYVGGRLQAEVIEPCESVYYVDDQRSITFAQVGDDTAASHALTVLRVDDYENDWISDTRTFIAKIDGVTVGKLQPIATGIAGRAEAELTQLDSFTKRHGRRLQVQIGRATYEANATLLSDVIRDLRACERERERRLHKDWNDNDYRSVHPQIRPFE